MATQLRWGAARGYVGVVLRVTLEWCWGVTLGRCLGWHVARNCTTTFGNAQNKLHKHLNTDFEIFDERFQVRFCDLKPIFENSKNFLEAGKFLFW